ncbi:hypothetical protein GU243_21910 [Pseudarthrobacter psychrotolerans]|uniref:Uncharacterized protein n=1 Tax=Pseudarthrobacter psychrotolerans TaxID=2697569 RepID=A0A6P1NQ75_9MICC|nr:hypothetical protein [Pseudarthrobacter psychrotolerans]QHK21879.1 hypothetical protein GU243_21910 [Pseudarthrobacter psychrotolerans]
MDQNRQPVMRLTTILDRQPHIRGHNSAAWKARWLWLSDLDGGISSEVNGGIVAHVAGLDGVRCGTLYARTNG